jgi:hypothetical protein
VYSNLRMLPRFNLDIPMRIRDLDQLDSHEHAVICSNISAGGVYFLTTTQLKIDTRVRAYLRMPEQIFGKPVVRWCCEGRVIHVHRVPHAASKVGVGLSFQMYAGLMADRLEVTDRQVPVRSWWPRPR